MNLIVSQYVLADSTPDFPVPVTLDRCPQRDGSIKWAVRDGSMCFSKAGRWEYEPSPSNRDDEFFSRCRWDSAEEALQAWRDAGSPNRFRYYRNADPQP